MNENYNVENFGRIKNINEVVKEFALNHWNS
jgi:hypothetical protein